MKLCEEKVERWWHLVTLGQHHHQLDITPRLTITITILVSVVYTRAGGRLELRSLSLSGSRPGQRRKWQPPTPGNYCSSPTLHNTTPLLGHQLSEHLDINTERHKTGTTPRQTFYRGFWDPIRSTESIRYTRHLQNEYIFCFNLAKRFISGLGHKSLIQCSCYNV